MGKKTKGTSRKPLKKTKYEGKISPRRNNYWVISPRDHCSTEIGSYAE
jgi:hypothetical protein